MRYLQNLTLRKKCLNQRERDTIAHPADVQL